MLERSVLEDFVFRLCGVDQVDGLVNSQQNFD